MTSSYDNWKTTEPDREPSPGEHRPYDDACDCDECNADRANLDDIDDEDEECTCSRSRADLEDERGFPCSCCGRMVR